MLERYNFLSSILSTVLKFNY